MALTPEEQKELDTLREEKRRHDDSLRQKQTKIPESETGKSWNVGDTLVAPWESMASFATGATAAPIAGWAGLIGAPLVGGERAGQITRDVQSGMT